MRVSNDLGVSASQIGDWLKQARVAAGLSREQAAGHLGVTYKTVERWEAGKHPPSGDTLIRAAKLYGVPFQDLVSVINVPRGTVLKESVAIPYALGTTFEAFTRELIRAGATDREVDFFADVLRRPETARLIKVSENAGPLPDSAVASQWDALLDDFRVLAHRWIAKRETKPVRAAIKVKDMPAAIAKELAARDAEKPKRKAR